MSFTFKWPRFSDQFHADAIQMLDAALNKGNKPPVIADKIEVVELEMGTQANPLNHKQPDIHIMGGSRGMLAAKKPLVVPMLLRLSHFKLNSYVVLVVSKQKGITLVFKTDPLQNVDINSTFDSIAVIQKFIQHEIEGQLRQMFREDLPGIIHRLSQQWVKAKVEAPYLDKRSPAARSESGAFSAYNAHLHRLPPRLPPVGVRPTLARTSSLASGTGRAQSATGLSTSSVGLKAFSTVSAPTSDNGPPAHEGPTTFPDLENFDPTYGLRPDGLPTKSVFNNLRSLFSPNKGLAELAEETSEHEEDDVGSFDIGTWEDLISDAPPSTCSPSEIGQIEEYETVPAVGGGTITRPRIIHSHSQILSPAGDLPRLPSRTPSRPVTASGLTASRLSNLESMNNQIRSKGSGGSRGLASMLERQNSWGGQYNPYFAGTTPMYSPSTSDLDEHPEDYSPYQSRIDSRYATPFSPSITPVPPFRHFPSRTGSPSSAYTHTSPSSGTHSIPTPTNPGSEDGGIPLNRVRRSSFTSSANLDRFGSPPDHLYLSGSDHDPKVMLKPGLNSVSRLTSLSHSNHTLSPYTRTLEHFTVRSVPPRENTPSGSASASERQPVKARRKRTFYLGQKPTLKEEERRPVRSSSPLPSSSDFDASDMDRYFRSGDDIVSQYADIHLSHVRRRSHYG
ncbi:hypothetical protein PHLCEN_2v4710 [Hermanssonia centrifuga]|uniref:DM34 domain-containing protein n=1 Tax=Hermanssonia centrifuga TaxID=98765 RepID=A0A2R6PN12_9APHY|nr:hypothetical protein PHLCEN_2v4710 [Hermanssonia centrifuga]